MKGNFKLFGVLFLMTLMIAGAFSSCSKDTDPADVDVFVGEYKGKISYVKLGNDRIASDEGKVLVTKVGKTYNFHFNKGIPDLTGIKFSKKDDNTLISISSGFKGEGITITKKKLVMVVVKGGETWTANCSR